MDSNKLIMPKTCGMVLCILLVSGCAFAQDSPMFRNDLNHSGTYSAGLSQFHGVKWKFHTHGEVNASPAIVDGVIYIGSNDGNFYALDEKTGLQKWVFATNGRIPSSPAVVNGGV